jgi:hypothetical protein
MKTNINFWSYLAHFFLEWESFHTEVVGKIKTHNLCSITLRKSCRLWNNLEKQSTVGQPTDDNITRRMRFACWIPKATDTHTEYEILIAFPLQQWLDERASMLRYTYIACLVFLDFALVPKVQLTTKLDSTASMVRNKY